MKKALKIAGIIIVLILALLIFLPYLYRHRITEIVKEEINNNLNASVDFHGVGISLFREFPHLTLRLKELSVINEVPFEGDTLIYARAVQLTFDLKSLFRGDAYVVREIAIRKPLIKLLTDRDGKVNWDIIPETQDTIAAPETSEEPSRMVIRLKRVSISNGQLIYDDQSLNFKTILTGITHWMSGDFAMSSTTLNTHTRAESLTVYYDNFRILHNVEAELSTPIQADFNEWIFTFAGSELRLNNFYLIFQGSFQMPDNGDYITNFTFSSKKTDFRDFLSLVPAMYATDLRKVKAAGTAVISGMVKGIYNDKLYPGFELNILVNNGRFHYPNLPRSVDEINVECKISFPESSNFDQLVVDLPVMSMFLGGNQLSLAFYASQPLSDRYVKGKVNGTLNLSEIKDFYPLPEGNNLKGKISAAISFDGKLSEIEKQHYDAFKLDGSIAMESLVYSTSLLPQPIEILRAMLSFSPRVLDLSAFDLKIGNNDLSATGKVEHFLPYYLYDGTISGNLKLSSGYLNINDLLPSSPETQPSTDTVPLSVIQIPGNIDFTIMSAIKTLVHGDLTLQNTEGQLVIRNKALRLEKLSMDALGGKITLNALYNTANPQEPIAEMDIRLEGIDIPMAYQQLGMVKQFAPLASNARGNFSAAVRINTLLDQQMTPIIQFMNGGGNLSTSAITLSNLKTLERLSGLLKIQEIRQPTLDPVNISFELIAGRMNVKPFDLKYQDILASAAGWISIDQTLDFEVLFSIPRTRFGGAVNQVVDNLTAEAGRLGIRFNPGEKINIKAKFTGNINQPEIKIMPAEHTPSSIKEELKRQMQDLIDQQRQRITDEIGRELEKKKQEARQKAEQILTDAERQALRIIEEAQRQAEAINKAAQESAAQLKAEAYRQADRIIEEGRKKGPIAEAAARKTAEQTRKEADKKAEQIISEAKTRSDKLLAEAQQQATRIRSDARKEADKLLE